MRADVEPVTRPQSVTARVMEADRLITEAEGLLHRAEQLLMGTESALPDPIHRAAGAERVPENPS